MALDPSTRARLPAAAAAVLAGTGVLALALGVALLVVPVPRLVGVDVPGTYRYVLAVFALLGGAVHLLAARWARQERDLFRTALATLVGMVLLQVSAPLDIVALACLWLARESFDSYRPR